MTNKYVNKETREVIEVVDFDFACSMPIPQFELDDFGNAAIFELINKWTYGLVLFKNSQGKHFGMTIDEFNRHYKLIDENSPKEIDNVKVLLDNGNVTTIKGFDASSMTAIAVQVENDLFITLKDCTRLDNWETSKKEAESVCKNSFLPNMDELRLWFENKKVVDDAFAVVGGEPLKGWYWSSDKKNSVSAWGLDSLGYEFWDYTGYSLNVHTRAFVKHKL